MIRRDSVEFNEKLQELRKSRGMTQEELAEALYVSRTAVSKWESGRGYPSIDSLKDISKFFSVSIDDLLSSEKLLSLAENENKSNIKNICDLLYGLVDLFFITLIVLPLYPNTVDGYIYSVSLLDYAEASPWILAVYWVVFILLIVIGAVKTALSKTKAERINKILIAVSLTVNVSAVVFLALTGEVYAVTVAFLLLVTKAAILLKRVRTDG